MSNRIKETTLPNDYLDGQILYGSDVNKIVNLLRNAVNYNKNDLDKLLFGHESDYVFNDVDEMNNFLAETTPSDGQHCFVMSDGVLEDRIYLYRYNLSSNIWVYYSAFSLLEIFSQNTGWYSGILITGASTNIEILSSLIDEDISINSFYLNTSTGYVYKCVSISGLNSYWDFQLSLSGELNYYQDTATTSVSYTLVSNEDKTFLNDSITDVTIIIPDTVAHGFYGGINIKVGSSIGAITFTNNSTYILNLIKYGRNLLNYTPNTNKTVNLSFYCDGINIYCYIVEV